MSHLSSFHLLLCLAFAGFFQSASFAQTTLEEADHPGFITYKITETLPEKDHKTVVGQLADGRILVQCAKTDQPDGSGISRKFFWVRRSGSGKVEVTPAKLEEWGFREMTTFSGNTIFYTKEEKGIVIFLQGKLTDEKQSFFPANDFQDFRDGGQGSQLRLALKFFLLLSNPSFHNAINWKKSPLFMEPTVIPDWNAEAQKCPDLLAKVFLKKGAKKPVLVLVESFTRLEVGLSKRVFGCFGRAFCMKEDCDLAVFGLFASLGNPAGCDRYKSDTGFGTRISFQFPILEIAKLREEDLPDLARKARG